MEIYADMVKIHYEYFKNKKIALRGTKEARDKRKDNYKQHITSNLKEISKYSDNDSMVFENNDEIVIAMRGLQPGKSLEDSVIGTEIYFEDAYQQSGSDFDTSTQKKKGISLLPNKYGEILLREQSKIDELKKEYPNKKIVLSGHSRGGRKAIDLGEKNQLEYHAFQPAEMNRIANPLLSMGTSAMMGAINPTDKIYKELVTSYMNRDAFEQGNRIGRTINNLFIEGYSPIQIQDKVISSAIQSDSYQTALGKFSQKIIVPEMTKRVSGIITDPQNIFREPADFTNIVSSEVLETQKQMEFGYSISNLQKQEKRTPPTESISNIYKTSNDLVSKGYQHTELVKPKQYAYGMFDHYLLGDHSIDHFISKNMFDSVNENRPIEDIKSDSLEDNFSPQSDITPSSSLGYTVDNVSLCRKYPNYSPHCKKILR
jgi:hypothetical protein